MTTPEALMPETWRHATRCSFERGETGEHDCTCGLFAFLAARRATPDPAIRRQGAADTSVLDSAYRMALAQVEHDGEVIKRLTQALRVASHKPHNQDGEPNEGFPTCSVCGAIQTEGAAAIAAGATERPLDEERLARALAATVDDIDRLPSLHADEVAREYARLAARPTEGMEP